MPQQFLYEQLGSVSKMEFLKSKKYKIIGLPFYNQEKENDFKEKLFENIG